MVFHGWIEMEKDGIGNGNSLWLRFNEKSEVGEIDMRHNSAGKTVHLIDDWMDGWIDGWIGIL